MALEDKKKDLSAVVVAAARTLVQQIYLAEDQAAFDEVAARVAKLTELLTRIISQSLPVPPPPPIPPPPCSQSQK